MSSGITKDEADINSFNSILDQIESTTGIRPVSQKTISILCHKLTNEGGKFWSYRTISSLTPKNPALSLNNNRERVPNNNSYDSKNIRIRVSEHSSTIAKIAVIGKDGILCNGSSDNGQSLAELVEGELLGIYGVVERKHLEEILDEQRLAMSGLLLEESDFAQAGCLAGAQGTILASYGCLQGETKLQVKLVDCSTSDLYWSATGLDVSAFDLMDALRIELSK
tara:strand:- start:107 stop:778 length:672 start_codon:yes stop_codon:yes gene_type:complete